MFLVRSVIAALYPATRELPGAAELELDAFLARYKREAPPLMWLGLLLGSLVFALSPLITVGWPLPSFWLPRAVLDRHAHRAATHPWYVLRQLVMVPKMIGGMCWAQHPSVRERHGVAAYLPDPGTWRR